MLYHCATLVVRFVRVTRSANGGNGNGNVSKSNLLPADAASGLQRKNRRLGEGRGKRDRGGQLMVTMPNRLRICQLTRSRQHRFDDFADYMSLYRCLPLSLSFSLSSVSHVDLVQI